jgi:hypothetical protein
MFILGLPVKHFSAAVQKKYHKQTNKPPNIVGSYLFHHSYVPLLIIDMTIT